MKKLTVLFVALAMVFGAMPAFAQDKADWSFYGQARMWTAWESVDKETLAGGDAGSKAGAWNPGIGGLAVQDDDVLDWQLQSNSRIGANVKWGSVGGNFEFGNEGAAGTVGGSADLRATFRQLYGTWNFGPGTLIVGKTYTPYFFLVSGLCGPGGGECNGIGFGSIYAGRRAQVTLQMGGFKFGLVEPETRFSPLMTSAGPRLLLHKTVLHLVLDVDQTLPRFEASYTFNLGPAALFLGGLYNRYEY